MTLHVTDYQGLPPLISPNTKHENSPLPQLMEKPPVDELDMCVSSTGTDRQTDTTHTQRPRHVTASKAVVTFLFPADVFGRWREGGEVELIALRVRELFHSFCKCQRTSYTTLPVGTVSVQVFGWLSDGRKEWGPQPYHTGQPTLVSYVLASGPKYLLYHPKY